MESDNQIGERIFMESRWRRESQVNAESIEMDEQFSWDKTAKEFEKWLEVILAEEESF